MSERPEVVLPQHLDEIDAAFMTKALRASGHIAGSNAVVATEECGVGMTAGYFSAIKKVKCAYRDPTEARDAFVVKAWPPFEILPKEAIAAMFVKDIRAYAFPGARFYPRPKTHLAAFDESDNRWALVMEDADSFAEHKVHESEMTEAEVMSMIPKMVDVAVAWEGCETGEKARELEALGVDFWASDANLAIYKQVMPGGAKLFDRFTASRGSTVVGEPTWDASVGPGFAELFTTRLDAFFARARPENGATCSLSHGDLRGDNIFFCEPCADYPDGWLCIDFQLLFRGPVPSDLAYLMSSGSVLPEVYAEPALSRVLSAFYDQFMQRTSLYKGYTFEAFVDEFAMMTMVPIVYYVGMGAAFWQGGALRNELPTRIELGGKGATEADLAPEELRQRMWWRKAFANYRANLIRFGLYDRLKALPETQAGLGPWVEVPDHLR
ncbi:MAG TPA: hypothetical protein VKT30_02960 [Caulobacteraceae bacterium]|nr:hypothetical protein [Caulobacteraceae bacterium]